MFPCALHAHVAIGRQLFLKNCSLVLLSLSQKLNVPAAVKRRMSSLGEDWLLVLTTDHGGTSRAHMSGGEQELFDGLAAGTYRRVVVCTGAGVSVPAGIPDFRSKGGLFETIRSRFGESFPEVLSRPETLLSRAFATRHPDAWRDEISPWLATWKQSAARPTPTHRFCRWLHDQGVLVRLYTQNVDGLHTHEDLLPTEKVVECHGSIRDGSIVLYGDALPPRVAHCLVEDFGAGSDDVDLVLVFGTSLQVAPFCCRPSA